jgi:multicomponent Na+:H+ antiporter subunit G
MTMVVGFFLVVGAAFMFVAALGVVRMPDVLLRMSSTTKSATLGAGCTLAAAAFHFEDLGVTTRAFATVIFLLATAPVAAHMISRAAYFSRVPLWKKMQVDELRSHYAREHPEPEGADERLDEPLSKRVERS